MSQASTIAKAEKPKARKTKPATATPLLKAIVQSIKDGPKSSTEAPKDPSTEAPKDPSTEAPKDPSTEAPKDPSPLDIMDVKAMNKLSKLKATSVFPEELVLVTDKADPLYDHRVDWVLDQKLISSIIDHGVIDPIMCFDRGGKLVVADGRQRTKAAREVNKALALAHKPLLAVPVVITPEVSKEKLYDYMVLLNEHRQEDSLINKARKAMAMMETYGKKAREVGLMFKIDETVLSRWLATLRKASPKVLALVDASDPLKSMDFNTANVFVRKVMDIEPKKSTQEEALRAIMSTGKRPNMKNVAETMSMLVKEEVEANKPPSAPGDTPTDGNTDKKDLAWNSRMAETPGKVKQVYDALHKGKSYDEIRKALAWALGILEKKPDGTVGKADGGEAIKAALKDLDA